MKEEPLTDAEVVELDSYGHISGRMLLPARAIELWEREIMYGRVTPEPQTNYLLSRLLDGAA